MNRRVPTILAALLLLAGCGRSLLAPDPAVEVGGGQTAFMGGSVTSGDVTAGRGTVGRLPLNGVIPNPVPLSEGPLPAIPEPARLWHDVGQSDVLPGENQIISGGRWDLEFKPGSVTEPTPIKIRCWDDKVLDFELGPHGTQFGTPVELRVRYSGTSADPSNLAYDGTRPALFWFDDARGVWVEVPGVDDRANQTYVVQLHHFSRYVLGGKAGW